MLMSDKIDFKPKTVKKKQGRSLYFDTIHQNVIAITKIYTHNIIAFKYIKQILRDLKKKTDNNKILVGNFNAIYSPMNRSSSQNMKKETCDINYILYQMALIDKYTTFYSNDEGYTFLLSTYEYSPKQRMW